MQLNNSYVSSFSLKCSKKLGIQLYKYLSCTKISFMSVYCDLYKRNICLFTVRKGVFYSFDSLISDLKSFFNRDFFFETLTVRGVGICG